MINKQTTLNLNGPILSFVQQPTSVNICNAGIATFVGIATATPVEATPTGFVVNDKIGPFKSKVVCLFNILNSFS